MGDINPSKMPKSKIIKRKDRPQDVEMYAKGGKIGSDAGKAVTVTKGATASAMARKLLAKPGSLKAADMYAKGGNVWDKPNPAKKHSKLSPAQKTKAKASAKAAGRPYPNLIDNMKVSSINQGEKN